MSATFAEVLKRGLFTVNPAPTLPAEVLVEIALWHSDAFSNLYRSSHYLRELLRPCIPDAIRYFRVPYPEEPYLFIYPDGELRGLKKVKCANDWETYQEVGQKGEQLTVGINKKFKQIYWHLGNEYRNWEMNVPHQLLLYRRGKWAHDTKNSYELRYTDDEWGKYHEADRHAYSYSTGFRHDIPAKYLTSHEAALYDTLCVLRKFELFFDAKWTPQHSISSLSISPPKSLSRLMIT